MTERIVETWEGVSPTRGLVRVNILSDGVGAGYDGTCEDGKAFEVKTIGLGSVRSAQDFCFGLGYACRDVPRWTRTWSREPDGVVSWGITPLRVDAPPAARSATVTRNG